jgi:hypothetical protein
MVSDILKNYKTIGCNMSLKIHFLGSRWGFSLTTLAPSVMSTGNAFTEIFASWKSGTRAGAAQIYLLTTARPSGQMLHRRNTADNQPKSPFR